MLAWIYSFGGEILKVPEPGLDQSVYQFDTPQVEDAFSFLRSLYDDNCAWLPETLTAEDEFANRLGLFSTGSVTDIPYQADAFRRAGSKDRWTVIPFPSPTANPAINTYGPAYIQFISTPQRQLAAWLFVKWLLLPQNQAQLIDSTGAFPIRGSVLGHMEAYMNDRPQWAEALEMIPLARSEPAFESWSTVRWALDDASTQLFRSYFTIDQVPTLLEFLDNTAAELHVGLEDPGIFHTPTSTPTPSATVTITPTPTATFTGAPLPSATLSETPSPSPLATTAVQGTPSPGLTATE